MPDLIAALRALLCAALIRALTEHLPQPPTPPEVPMEQHRYDRISFGWRCPVCGRQLDARRVCIVPGNAYVTHYGADGAPADDDETDDTPPPAWLVATLEEIARG
jgi:hypothetical protein